MPLGHLSFSPRCTFRTYPWLFRKLINLEKYELEGAKNIAVRNQIYSPSSLSLRLGLLLIPTS